MVTPIQSKQNKSAIFWKIETQLNTTLFFKGYQLEFVFPHKHLDWLFSDDLKISMYIDSIENHAYKKLGFIKKLKFTLSRNNYQKCMSLFKGWLFNFGY